MAPEANSKQAIRDRLTEAYGYDTIQDLLAGKENKAALKECGGDQRKAMRRLLIKKESVNQPAIFLRNDIFEKYNKKEAKYEVKDRGPSVVLPDGTVKTFWIGEDVDAAAGSSIQIGPMKQTYNIEKNSRGAPKSTEKTKAKLLEPGTVSVPDIGIKSVLDNLLKPRKSYHTIMHTTPPFKMPVFTGVVEADDEDARVGYWDGGEDRDALVFIPVKTSDGYHVEVTAGAAQVGDAFDLDDSAESDDYTSALDGEPVLVQGQVSLTKRLTRKSFEKEDEEELFDEFISLVEQYMDGYKDAKDGSGSKLRRLNWKKVIEGEGEEFKEGIELGNYQVWDVVEYDVDEFEIYATEDNLDLIDYPPNVDAVEAEFQRKDGSGTFVRNKGACILFLNHATESVGVGAGTDDTTLDFLLDEVDEGDNEAAGEAPAKKVKAPVKKVKKGKLGGLTRTDSKVPEGMAPPDEEE